MADPDGPQIDPEVWAEEMWEQEILPHVISVEAWLKEAADKLGEAAEAVEAAANAPPPDTRTPIQKLLEAFVLEAEKKVKDEVANWNAAEEDRKMDREVALEAKASVDKARQGVGGPDAGIADDVLAGALAAASDFLGKFAEEVVKPKEASTDAQVHVSDSAELFPDWHIKGGKLDEDFDMPLVVPLSDEPVREGVTRADLIAKARAMIPKIPVQKGGGRPKPGTLSWTKYPVRGTEGWVYTDDPKSDYIKSLDKSFKQIYDTAAANAKAVEADPNTKAAARLKARAAKWQAATVFAVRNQEGSPSTINTYDGLVLTWGIGIAGPGKLPQTFHEIMQDPHVKKALYLCGFHYQGIVVGNQYHGGYQVVDLEKKQIVFRDNFYHKNSEPGAKPSYKKGGFEGNAYKALKVLTDQPEMMMLLIQLAKDPLTGFTILNPNYKMIQSFVSLTEAQEIKNEALYVFAGQVRHNWAFDQGVVKWAASRLTPEEDGDKTPSDARDAAIAKGICRLVMSKIQHQRWTNAVKALIKGKEKPPILLAKTNANIEFELTRLRRNYLTPLNSGANTLDGSKVDTGDFLKKPVTGTPPADHYVCVDYRNDPDKAAYDLGPVSQHDLLFPSDNIQLLRMDGGNVVIKDHTDTERTVTQDGKPI